MRGSGVRGRRGKRGGTAAVLDRAAGVLVRASVPARSERVPPYPRRPRRRPLTRLPRRSSADVLAFWKHDDTFQASIDQREGAPEWVFYDGPPFANGLPHYGHLLTGLREGPLPALPDHARQAGAPPLRLGHPRTARRARGRAPARHHRQERDRGDGHRGLQRRPPATSVLRYTKEWEEYVTRQARWVDFENDYKTLDVTFMETRHLGVQAACTTRASPTRATACCRTAGATRRRCRTTSCAWTTTSTRCARTRRSPSPSRSSARRPRRSGSPPCARSPGRRRRGRCRRTSRSRSAPTSSTPSFPPARTARPTRPCSESGPRHRHRGARRRVPARRDLVGSYAKELGYESADDARGRRLAAPSRGAELEGVTYDRLCDYYADVEAYGTAERLADPRRRLRHDRGRHRHRAPGARLRRGGPEGRRGGRHPGHPLARRRRPVPARGARMSRACSGATRTSRSPSC